MAKRICKDCSHWIAATNASIAECDVHRIMKRATDSCMLFSERTTQAERDAGLDVVRKLRKIAKERGDFNGDE